MSELKVKAVVRTKSNNKPVVRCILSDDRCYNAVVNNEDYFKSLSTICERISIDLKNDDLIDQVMLRVEKWNLSSTISPKIVEQVNEVPEPEPTVDPEPAVEETPTPEPEQPKKTKKTKEQVKQELIDILA